MRHAVSLLAIKPEIRPLSRATAPEISAAITTSLRLHLLHFIGPRAVPHTSAKYIYCVPLALSAALTTPTLCWLPACTEKPVFVSRTPML